MRVVPETLSAEQHALRARIAEFVEREIAPLERSSALDFDAPVPVALRRQVAQAARAAGVHGLLQRTAVGSESDGERVKTGVVERVIAVETLAASNLRLARYALGPEPGLLASAQGALRERYLLPLLSGDKRSALAITEPRDGSGATLATRDQGALVVTGRKSFVTGGAEADFFVVSVALASAAGQPATRALVVVDRDAPGLRVERAFHSADGSGHVELAFERVRISEEQLLAAPSAGAEALRSGLSELRLRVAARACGAALWAIEHVTARLGAPHRSGVPLGEREGVRLRLADMALALYAARSALYRTARLADSGHDIRHEAMAAKILCTESAVQVLDRAALLAGGEATIEGHPLERMQRELRTLLVAEGASDVLRQSLAKGIVERGFRRF